jgi:ribosomal protein L39E
MNEDRGKDIRFLEVEKRNEKIPHHIHVKIASV